MFEIDNERLETFPGATIIRYIYIQIFTKSYMAIVLQKPLYSEKSALINSKARNSETETVYRNLSLVQVI